VDQQKNTKGEREGIKTPGSNILGSRVPAVSGGATWNEVSELKIVSGVTKKGVHKNPSKQKRSEGEKGEKTDPSLAGKGLV